MQDFQIRYSNIEELSNEELVDLSFYKERSKAEKNKYKIKLKELKNNKYWIYKAPYIIEKRELQGIYQAKKTDLKEQYLFREKLAQLKLDRINNKNSYLEQKKTLKQNLKKELEYIKTSSKDARNQIKSKRLLVNTNGDWFYSKENDFKDKLSELNQVYKVNKNLLEYNNRFERKLKILQLKNEYYSNLKNDSYRYEYLYHVTKEKIRYLLEVNLYKDKINHKIINANQKYLELKEDKHDNLVLIKSQIEQIKEDFEANKHHYHDKKEYKRYLNLEINNTKYKNEYLKSKIALKHLKEERRKQLRTYKEVHNYNLSDIKNKIVIQRPTGYKFMVLLAAILLPGAGQIINKQWIKGILIMLCLPLFAMLLVYAFGIGNVGGEGIFGLISLGNGVDRDKFILPDSRFFLIEGVIALVIIVIFASFYIVTIYNAFLQAWQQEKGSRSTNWNETKRYLQSQGLPYLLSLPALLLITFIVIVPIVSTILISFTNFGDGHMPPGDTFNWVGVSNYQKIFGGDWTESLNSVFLWTIIWTLLATFGTLIAGMLAAFLLSSKRLKGKAFFRVFMILPWAVPAFITIMLFSLLFADQGPIEKMTRPLGLNNWKHNATLTKAALIFIQSWLGQSYIFLLTTGVMQGISNDLYDAAKIDGANHWKQTAKITIPIIITQIAPLLLGQFTFNFNNFSIIYLFNGGGPAIEPRLTGGPGATDILLSFIFKLTTANPNRSAMGAAFALITSVFVILISAISFRQMKAFRR